MLSARFTADGSFDQGRGEPIVGTDALAAFGGNFPNMVKGRHWNSNLLIEPSAGGASGKVYLMLMNLAAEGGPSPLVTAVYHDDLVNTDDGWRFAARRVVGDA